MASPTSSGGEHKPVRSGSLRRQLFLLFLSVSLVPLLVSNVWGYLQSRGVLLESSQHNVASVAAMAASQLGAFADDKVDEVVALAAASPEFASTVRALAAFEYEAQLLAGATLHTTLRARASGHQGLDALVVYSAAGAELGSSNAGRPRQDTPVPLACAPGAALARRRSFEASAPGVVHLSVGATLLDEEGIAFGLLCARYVVELHREIERAARSRSPGAHVELLDETGRAATRVDGALPLEREVIAARASLPGSSWAVVVQSPVADALVPLERLKWQAVALSALLVVVLGWAVFFVARSLAGRLSTLADATHRIAEGAFGEFVAVEGPDETVALATAFNRMSRSVAEARGTLEQRVAERTRELEGNLALTQLLIDSIDESVVVVDRTRKVIRANRAAALLYGDGIIGRSHDALLAEGAECTICRTFREGAPQRAERSQRTARGDIEILEVSTCLLPAAGRDAEAVMEIGRLVTSERQNLAKMVHHEKMAAFGLLAAGVAHEVGNPLASIKWQIRALRDRGQPESSDASLAVIEKELARALQLLYELGSFFRRKRDEVTLVSVAQLIDDVVRLLSHDPRARGVQLRADVPPALPAVRAREDDLIQVLLNLGLNALDAMPSGGELVFSATADEGSVRVRVQDTGTGVAPEAQARIFEPFFTTKAAGRGTGLGLFVSKGLVEGLGGRLELDATGPGGTCFVATLRVAEAEQPRELR